MILSIIQARMGATRLPGKVMLDLGGKTVLERVIEKVKAARLVNEVMVATTSNLKDKSIVDLCKKIGVRVFEGSESDVLDRYYQAALIVKPHHVVRITADCPLMDTGIIDAVIERHLAAAADYTANTLEETFPDGEDVEVFRFDVLEKAWQKAVFVSEREHVTPFIRKNSGLFKLANLKSEFDLSKKRWTLDNPEDYEFIKKIYGKLHRLNASFTMTDILNLLKQEPELEMINSHIQRNEGYAKYLKEDRVFEVKNG